MNKSLIITVLTAISIVIGAIATTFAVMQPPYPDPLKKKSLLEHLLYPIEVNPEQRVQYINVDFNDVFFLPDGKTGWAVGSSGAILATKNGGQTWERQDSGVEVVLTSLTFINERVGWAVGVGGVILTTKDGGSNWSRQLNSKELTLRSLAFIDEKIGWAVGDDGMILATVDGGNNWTEQQSKTKSDLNSVMFINKQKGWAVGVGGIILTTENGGEQWVQVSYLVSIFLNYTSVLFINENIGWIVGAGGIVLSTTDGGENWYQKKIDPTSFLQSIDFINEHIGWIVGNDGKIFSTIDGGNNWTSNHNNNKYRHYSVMFINEQVGWIVGHGGEILSTINGGENWIQQSNGITGSLHSINFIDQQNGWISSDDGMNYYTNNGGYSWHPQSRADTNLLKSVTFINKQNGWAVGGYGIILSTIDGGKEWATKYPIPTQLNSVTFVNEQVGWAVGEQGGVLSTSNGGLSWTKQSSGTTSSLNSVTFINEQNGWAVGSNGLIISTTNGGQSWAKQSSDTTNSLNSITFINEQNGWAVGSNGLIISTSNGGQSWAKQSSGTTSSLNSVTFINEQNGWVVGSNGLIISTTNGGLSWTKQISGTSSRLSSAIFINEQTGWAVGAGGIILSTEDGGINWNIYENSRYYLKLPALWFFTLTLLLLILLIIVVLILFKSEKRERQTINELAESDAHVKDSSNDYLKFTPIAEGISRFIRNESTTPPLTIAVEGAWGTGKSSLLELTKHDLIKHGYSPVWFNAWHHENEKSLLAALLENIRQKGIPSICTKQGKAFRYKLILSRIKRLYPYIITIILIYIFSFTTILYSDLSINELLLSYNDFLEFISKININTTKPKGWIEQLPWLTLLCNTGLAIPALGVIFKPFYKPLKSVIKSIKGVFTIKGFKEDTGFRYKFGKEFNEVTDALAPRHLVIIIDDLDRCAPENVAFILEAVNFLVSEGDCFVLMGIERSRVEVCIGLAYEKIADVIINDHSIKKDEKKIVEYARAYLEKLINIEIAVPCHNRNPDCYKNLLISNPATKTSSSNKISKLQQLIGGILFLLYKKKKIIKSIPTSFIIMLIVIFLVIGFGIKIGETITELTQKRIAYELKQEKVRKEIAFEDTTTDKTIAKKIVVERPDEQESGVQVSEVVFRAVVPRTDNYLILLWLITIPVPLFLWLIVPNRVTPIDSPEFIESFKIWENLLLEKLHTPRAIKRFKNKVRFYAMRFNARPDETSRLERYLMNNNFIKQIKENDFCFPELLLITMAALYEYNSQLILDDTNWQEVKALLNSSPPPQSGPGTTNIFLRLFNLIIKQVPTNLVPQSYHSFIKTILNRQKSIINKKIDITKKRHGIIRKRQQIKFNREELKRKGRILKIKLLRAKLKRAIAKTKGHKTEVKGLKVEIKGLKKENKGLKKELTGLRIGIKGLKTKIKNSNIKLYPIEITDKMRENFLLIIRDNDLPVKKSWKERVKSFFRIK